MLPFQHCHIMWKESNAVVHVSHVKCFPLTSCVPLLSHFRGKINLEHPDSIIGLIGSMEPNAQNNSETSVMNLNDKLLSQMLSFLAHRTLLKLRKF